MRKCWCVFADKKWQKKLLKDGRKRGQRKNTEMSWKKRNINSRGLAMRVRRILITENVMVETLFG